MSARTAFTPTVNAVLSFRLNELRSRDAGLEVIVSANVIIVLAGPSVNLAAHTHSAKIKSKPLLCFAPAGIKPVKNDRN